jgi:diguanylate cyclase (GGDEF)-like protein
MPNVAERGGDDPGAGQIAGSVVAVILRCVERVAGDDGVARLIALAGETRTPSQLRRGTSWTPYATAVAFFRGGIEVTGNPAFARYVGEEMLRQYDGSEVAALFRSLGSPGEVLRNVAKTAWKFSTATRLEALEIGDDYAKIEAWAIAGLERDVTFCDYTAGIISQASALFGMDPSKVVETRCQRLGDPRCLYEVTWDHETSPDANPQRRIEHLESQLALLTARFEAMQEVARELVSTDGIEQVLATIPDRAARAVHATRHLLAVSLGPGDLRLHGHGFVDHAEMQRIAHEILADEPDDRDGSRLIVDVTVGTRNFGRLAALYPNGAQFFPAERRMLEAYAATAATAINTADALDQARRESRTAKALLSLASSLVDARTVDAVAERLATAVPKVIGCRRASVLVWDEPQHALTYRGIAGVDGSLEATMRTQVIRPEDVPELQQMVETPRSVVLDMEAASPALCNLLEAAEVRRVCIVPLMARGDFLGIVTAPMRADDETPDLWDRLQGLADQGATALQNAHLVEQVHHQALHDGLTGLPNRALLEDRLGQALAKRRRTRRDVALLFIDLDRFKDVNDTFGHAAGDALLRVAATRLRATVRSADTVARLGGDEFVVLLTDLRDESDAHSVAAKLLATMREPIDVGAATVTVSASIGVTLATGADDIESLLGSADRAMYRAKAAGRDQVSV